MEIKSKWAGDDASGGNNSFGELVYALGQGQLCADISLGRSFRQGMCLVLE